MQKSSGILCLSNQCAYKYETNQNARYAVRKYIGKKSPKEVQEFLYLDRTVLRHTLLLLPIHFIKRMYYVLSTTKIM